MTSACRGGCRLGRLDRHGRGEPGQLEHPGDLGRDVTEVDLAAVDVLPVQQRREQADARRRP